VSDRVGIDLNREQVLSLAEAAQTLPAPDGKHVATSTVWRWCKRGIRGVRLEYARIGRRMVTSREALTRFANRLAERDAEEEEAAGGAAIPRRTTRQRQRDFERAEAELDVAGL